MNREIAGIYGYSGPSTIVLIVRLTSLVTFGEHVRRRDRRRVIGRLRKLYAVYWHSAGGDPAFGIAPYD